MNKRMLFCLGEGKHESRGARDLQTKLGYATWENFEKAIERAKDSLSTSDINVTIESQFRKATKQRTRMHQSGQTYTINIPDYHLTRYACYLIAQRGIVYESRRY